MKSKPHDDCQIFTIERVVHLGRAKRPTTWINNGLHFTGRGCHMAAIKNARLTSAIKTRWLK